MPLLSFYWRISEGFIGECVLDKLAKVQWTLANWRKYSGRSPMAKVRFAKVLLAKFRLPMAVAMVEKQSLCCGW
jgi:hypothetical protein